MSFPKEPIEFTEQYPSIPDQQGIVEGLSELSRFRIRRAFRPLTGVVAPLNGGSFIYNMDPLLDRVVIAYANAGALDGVTVRLPLAENADATHYTVVRGDEYVVSKPVAVGVQIATGDTARIEGLTLMYLSCRYQSISVQSDGVNWRLV